MSSQGSQAGLSGHRGAGKGPGRERCPDARPDPDHRRARRALSGRCALWRRREPRPAGAGRPLRSHCRKGSTCSFHSEALAEAVRARVGAAPRLQTLFLPEGVPRATLRPCSGRDTCRASLEVGKEESTLSWRTQRGGLLCSPRRAPRTPSPWETGPSITSEKPAGRASARGSAAPISLQAGRKRQAAPPRGIKTPPPRGLFVLEASH